MKAGSQKLQDDRTSHCWSFGSTNHPSSQSRKISVGVMVDSIPKKASEASKERDIAGLDGERVKSTTLRTSSNGKGMIEERTATKKPKQTEVVNQVNSPWVSTKKIYQQGTTSETVLCPNQTSDLPASGRTKLDGGLARSVSLFTSETSVLPSDDSRLKKFSGVTYGRKQKKDVATERMQDFTFATAQDAPMPDFEVMKNKTNATENGKTISLRLRLQEILGAVSSPNDHYSESPTPEFGANMLTPDHDKMGDTVRNPRQSSDKQEQKSELKGDALSKPSLGSNKQKQNVDQIGDALLKHRQNSDTIETDSDCPDHKVERPVTRSLTRRRAPARIIKKTTKNGKSSDNKLKHQEKNISSHATDGGSSPMLTKKKYERKSSKVKPLYLFKGIAEKIQQPTHLSVSPLPAQKTSTFGTVHSHSHLSDKERDCDLKSIPNNNPDNAPLPDDQDNRYKDPDSPGNRDQPDHIVASSEKRKENLGSPSVWKFVDQDDVLQSPTFGVNTPATSSFLSSTPKTDPIEEIPGFSYGKKLNSYGDKQIESSVSLVNLRVRNDMSAPLLPSGFVFLPLCLSLWNSQDDSDKPKDSRTRKASSVLKASLMEASSDDNYSVSSEEYLPSSDEFDTKKLTRPANKLRNKEINVRLNHTKTSSPSIKGRRERNRIPNSSEQNKVDGLTRALELFALELEKLKSKIKSATTKKASEILMSVAEDVHLQLQRAETHIQMDMGKLKNLSKLKRKRVETRFEEQQERLQLIYTKFKEQINQHLQDCKSTFEGLEADQEELKGTLEKRKSSHRKLLMQVEESIEIQLHDAQKKITETHEVARENMAQLKQVLGLCLKDDILT